MSSRTSCRVASWAALALAAVSFGNWSGAASGIELEITPRVCTLSAKERQCTTTVHASWRAPQDESLCLIILGRSDVKRCWEHYSQGDYSLEMVFSDDLVFALTDTRLDSVLASQALRIIREAIRYRHRRRNPWNLFE
jgi:hypothetical protein